MRGKAVNPCIAVNPCRITPAYAGKSCVRDFADTRYRDHPRLCGEKLIPIEFGGIETGSPPPMRGKGRKQSKTMGVFRITPAYAGKRPVALNHIFKLEDHPRLCGEKFLSVSWKIFWTGSPPPMRGKVFDQINQKQLPGITPAYAGKSMQLG